MIARRNHVVPQAYLASFTDTGTHDGRLFVCEVRTGRVFTANPRRVAVERYFNRSDESDAPDGIEKALARFECRAMSAIRRTCEESRLAGDEDFSYVLNLMALLVVHNPRRRRAMNRAMEHSYRIIVDLLASDRSLYQSQIRKAHEAGFVTNPEFPFERFQKFVLGGRYRLEVTTDASLGIEFRVFDSVPNLLGRRHWSLLVAADEAAHFITSDQPVALFYKDLRAGGTIGLGLRNTAVMFPLSPKLALYGVLEEPLPSRVVASSNAVEELNERTISHADRHVFGQSGHER